MFFLSTEIVWAELGKEILFSLGDSRSLWMDLKVLTKRSNFHSNSEFIWVRIL